MAVTVDETKIHQILVITLSNLGDVVLTTPVISFMRRRFPSAFLAVVVGPKGVPLFAKSQTVNEVIVFDKHASWFEQLMFVLRLRRRKFDLVVDLRNTAIPFFLTPRYRTSFFVDRSSTSMRQRHLDRLKPLFPILDSDNRFDFYNEEDMQSALGKLHHCLPHANLNHLVIIGPGAGSSLKRWTISGFVALGNYFLNSGKSVVLVGDSSERQIGAALTERISKPIANLIGLLTLRESASLIDRALLVVANDSAVMHLACELGRPAVSIFGPTNERKYGRTGELWRTVRLNLDCAPCEQAQCRLERRICLDDLPVSQVIEATEELLGARARSTFQN